MKPNNISFPVNLGTTQWGTASFGQLVYVYDGDGDCLMTCNYSAGIDGGYPCTTNFTLWWVGAGQFALQVADNQWTCYAPNVGLYTAFPEGAAFWQVTDSSITQYSTFGLENLGGGNVAITKYAGEYLNGSQPYGDWNFNGIMYHADPKPPDPNTIFTTGHPNFHILLVSGSGVGLDFTGQNFADGGYIHSISDTDFIGANLTSANLSTLPDRSVASCNFKGATVTGAILTGVQNLNKATWTSAVLAHTDLSKVDPNGVAGIDFSTLESETRVDLTGATLSNGKPLAANFKYGAANFNHANLSQAVLDRIDFVGAHFRKAILAGANLTGADLSNADLTGADLTRAILADTILAGATLDGTMFDHCDLSTTKFGPAPKFGTSCSTRTCFRSATVPASTLGSNWSYLDLTDATITHIPKSIANLNADQALLPDQLNLQDVDLTDATFRKARMYGIQLQRANLQGATMTDAKLKSAWLDGANLTLADLSGAWLIIETATPKTPVDKLAAASLTGAFMFNARLDQAHCDGVDFTFANFSTSGEEGSASAVNAYMNDALFNNACVLNANFSGVQLSGANLASALLIGTKFKNSASSAAEFTPSIRVGSRASVSSADLSGTDFTGANMDGLDMDKAIVATTDGNLFNKKFTSYHGATVQVIFSYGKTVFGNTTPNTICPDNNSGPCSVN